MNENIIKEKIYDKTARLSKQFINFIKNEGVPDDLLPFFHENGGYQFDWNIIGDKEIRDLFEPYKFPIDNQHPFNVTQKRSVQDWLNWISRKIFLPERMVGSAVKTDAVLMRIAFAKVDKLEIPMFYKHMITDNMLYTYWIRKRAYDAYWCKEVIQFPFAPDFIIKL